MDGLRSGYLASLRPPEMSIVLVTPDSYQNLRRVITHLHEQTARGLLEVVIVSPSISRLGLVTAELEGFRQVRLVEVGQINSTAAAITAGVLQASAPVVAYVEEHSYPEPGWAQALLTAHRQSWAAVGTVMSNANPESILSWAEFFLDFGPWVEPASAGERDRLPSHNTAYKRAVLLEYGSNLEAFLEHEHLLHWDLAVRGFRLYLESAARTRHLNISLLSSFIVSEFYGGRIFGGARARHRRWSILRRLIYVLATPLIPLVRLRRVLGDIQRSGQKSHLLPRVLPILIVGLIAHTLGEAMGYALGAGDAPRRRMNFELRRFQHISPKDRQNRP